MSVCSEDLKQVTERFTGELKKMLLYGLLSNMRQHFESHASQKPSDILDNVDIDTLPVKERDSLEKYRDAISLQIIEHPVCIMTEHNNTVHRDYYDIKSIYQHIITAILLDTVQVEDLHSSSINQLHTLLFEACFNAVFKLNCTKNKIIINNPLNRQPISPASINLVDDNYLEAAIKIQKQYESLKTHDNEYIDAKRLSP